MRPPLAGLGLVGLMALGACKSPDAVSVIELPDNRLAAVIAVQDRVEVHASGRCVANDDGETRVLPRQGPGDALGLEVAGLRADTPWTCTVEVDRGNRVREHEVVLEPTDLPPDLGGYTVEGQTDGHTLLTAWEHQAQHPNVRSVIVDPHGRVRWYRYTDIPVITGLDSAQASTGHIVTGGGPDQPPTWYDGVSDPVQRLGEPPIPGPYHHHAEPTDGGVLTLVEVPNTRTDGSEFRGFAVVWFGPTGVGEWVWNSQEAVDAGTLVPGPLDDAFHANSVSFVDDAHGPAAWVSLYRPSQLVRIDRQTGAVTHVVGPDTDMPLSMSGIHDPEFLADGRVVLLDNGRDTGTSRVLELALDLDARTASLTRSWTEDGWFEPIFGDADPLEDGRILVARGRCWENCGIQDSLPADRLSDVIEVAPDDSVPWRLVAPTDRRGIYRAERVDVCLLWTDPDRC